MMVGRWRNAPLVAAATLAMPAGAQMTMPVPAAASDMGAAARSMQGDMASMPGMDHAMTGILGHYPMARESSGTAWQPDSSPMTGLHWMSGDWSLMAHGYVTGVYDDQGSPRGDTKAFSESMAMLMANRPLGGRGTLGLRAMLSLDPLMGKSGYPLLFATGETADGTSELIDRQHPHDLFMELSASYARDLGDGRALSLYAGLPGEPALGPPTFMHRISGMANPEAPIGHHWFDSTHITFGVVTAGFSTSRWKVEASAFEGREPDQHRYDIEAPKLDSWSVRAFWNPTANLSLQASTGHLHSPEQLDPDRNEQRTTVSATYDLPLGRGGNWASTVAWSLKDPEPGPRLSGWLAESALTFTRRHTVFARAEREREDELFEEGSSPAGDIFAIGKLSLGYQYELPVGRSLRLAVGGLVSAFAYSERLRPIYGSAGVKSLMLFTRLSLGQ